MASTYSTNLGFELISAGDQSGSWGNTTNNNFGNLVEQSIGGYGSAVVATGTTTNIIIPNGAAGTARNMVISVTGTGGASTYLAVPNGKTKIYIVFNGASGAITVSTVSGLGVSMPASTKAILYCDGTDVVNVANYFSSMTFGTPLPVASGGTGAASTTAYAVYAGNAGGTGFTPIPPSTAGNILTSNGTSWGSAPLNAFNGTATLSSNSSISDGTTGFAVGYLAVPQNAQNSNYTLVSADIGKHIYSTNTGAQSITIPANASVAFAIGTALTIVNNGTTSISLNAAPVTLYQAGTTNFGNRTIDPKGMATLLKVDTNTWFISGSGVS